MWLNILFWDLLFPQILITAHVPCDQRASFYFHFEGLITSLVSLGALLINTGIDFICFFSITEITSEIFLWSVKKQAVLSLLFVHIGFTNVCNSHKFQRPNPTVIAVYECTGCNRLELAPAAS